MTLTLLGGVSLVVLGTSTADAYYVQPLTGPTVTIGTPVATTGTISATAGGTVGWAPGTTISPGNSLTFTLSAGAQFAVAPSVVATGPFGTGSLNSNATAYSIQVASPGLVPGSASLALTNIQINNYASSISNSTGAVSLTYAGVLADPPQTLTLVTFAPALTVTNNLVPLAATVDVPSGATRFVATSGTTTTPLVALGNITVNATAGAVTLAGATIAPTVSGSTVTVTGPLGGVSTVFVSPTSTTASTVPSSATTATPSGNSVALAFPSTASTIANGTYSVYGLATGNTILDTGSFSLGSSLALTSGSSFTGSQTTTATTGYNGTVATVNYAVGSSNSYSSYLFVTNRSLAATPVLVSVVPQSGASPISGTLVSALAANSATLISGPQIDAALGTSLFTRTGQRSSLRVLVGASSSAVTGLLTNPSGDVTDIGMSFGGASAAPVPPR
ncbi:MAG: hypothetical protein P4M00_09120 [Azospirillaceae bacterium]|nr:hypothetical protein [Azospirillaceae bacterium]